MIGRHGPAPSLRRRGLTELELGEQPEQFFGFMGQPLSRPIGFLDHGGILLRSLIHGIDRGIDLLQAGRLFAGGLDDRGNIGVDLEHLGHDRFERLAGFTDQCHAVLHMAIGGADQVLDFLGRLRQREQPRRPH